jgi:hypothetical protein
MSDEAELVLDGVVSELFRLQRQVETLENLLLERNGQAVAGRSLEREGSPSR